MMFGRTQAVRFFFFFHIVHFFFFFLGEITWFFICSLIKVEEEEVNFVSCLLYIYV